MEDCHPSLKCFYAILGVEKDSSCADIRSAYRKLAMRWHPDKCANAKGDAREQAKLKFQVVQEAYAVLSDENKRFCYDAGLHEEVEGDPGMQDFMAELAKMMSVEVSVPNESNADDEFEELKKLFMNIVDTDTYLPGREGLGTSSRSSDQEHFQEPKPRSPTANTYDRDHQFFSLTRTSRDATQDVSLADQLLDHTSPKAHPELSMTEDCPQFDFNCGSFDDTSRSFTYEYEELSSSCAQPHADPCTEEERQCFDFDAGKSSSDFEQATQRFSEFNFASPTSTPTYIKPSTPTNLNSEGFCIGVSGDGAVKDCRRQGRHVKIRKRRCKDKVAGVPPPATCAVCGAEKLGIGPGCLCTESLLNT